MKNKPRVFLLGGNANNPDVQEAMEELRALGHEPAHVQSMDLGSGVSLNAGRQSGHACACHCADGCASGGQCCQDAPEPGPGKCITDAGVAIRELALVLRPTRMIGTMDTKAQAQAHMYLGAGALTKYTVDVVGDRITTRSTDRGAAGSNLIDDVTVDADFPQFKAVQYLAKRLREHAGV